MRDLETSTLPKMNYEVAVRAMANPLEYRWPACSSVPPWEPATAGPQCQPQPDGQPPALLPVAPAPSPPSLCHQLLLVCWPSTRAVVMRCPCAERALRRHGRTGAHIHPQQAPGALSRRIRPAVRPMDGPVAPLEAWHTPVRRGTGHLGRRLTASLGAGAGLPVIADTGRKQKVCHQRILKKAQINQ